MADREQQATCGRSLFSGYTPPNLENKFLCQTSITKPAAQASSCSSLQPSALSSTSSSLLSSTSPHLSTRNKLLTTASSHLSSVLNTSLLSTSVLSPPPPLVHHRGLGGEPTRDDGEQISETTQSCSEGTSVFNEEEEVLPEEKKKVGDFGSNVEFPLLETVLADEELEHTPVIGQEKFAELHRGSGNVAEELQDKKYLLLNAVFCSLVNKNTAPGLEDWDSENSVWTRITNLAKDISVSDPQFLLKVAVYTRQELNISITANFLLALAASQPTTRPHVRRYFCAAVQLPSDWLEVVRVYSTCFSRTLPTCLKKAMADKFRQFSEYQLAKNNTRKHRCKHNRNRGKNTGPTDEQLKQWADLVRADVSVLKKFLEVQDSKMAVNKKESDFSMKKMIKTLHIKEPAEHVMAILGKKYPADLKTFSRSGMTGAWDRDRAGQRMKLREPETWERLLSQEGNTAATWERLIDNRSLPFMAMLRNLRNMITKGISEAHHKKILSRLTNKNAVIQSRQFPFRFLAAYKVIMELHTLVSASQQNLPVVKEILKGILKKIPKGRRFRRVDWETTQRRRIRVTLGVPFICRMYRLKKVQLQKAKQQHYTADLLDRYRKALEAAVQISWRYNVPLLPGRTVIMFYAPMMSSERKQDFCLPPDPEENYEEDKKKNRRFRKWMKQEEGQDKLTASMTELSVLLSVMIGSSAEDCQICANYWHNVEEIKLESDVLLENVRSVMKQIKTYPKMSNGYDQSKSLSRILKMQNKVDNIIVVADFIIVRDVQWDINNYVKQINNKALVVNIYLSDRDPEYPADRNSVVLSGFSEQIMRFVAERGSSRLLEHVEHLDKVYNIPPPERDKVRDTAAVIVPIPARTKSRWRGVRVFISSTFRDMHAERHTLVRSVFPELRRRAAPHCLHLQEVELRWGVTEEESARATELCLSEVCRSQMMVGILGERYGLVPPRPALPDLPQYGWLTSAPPGLSVTEMEIRQFLALYPDTAHQRMFCYFRDPNVTKSVPVAWRSDFVPESKEAKMKMASLKSRIRASEVKTLENYLCDWGGAVEGKPYLKNLGDFAKAVLEDLWMAVKQFVEEDEEAEAASEVTEQEDLQGALQRQFFGRAKLLSGAVAIVEQVQTKGGMMLVEGGPGDGKTVFMAALADALRTGVKSKRNLVCDVISYSTAASQSARSMEKLLRCFAHWFWKIKDPENESPSPHSYKDLLSDFHSILSDMKRDKPLVLLVDGADLVQDGGGQLSSDWIPQQLPQGVCLVLSITTKAALVQSLIKRRGAVLFALGPLALQDRKEIVQKKLDAFGKNLSDSALKYQLQTLVMKSGAVSPLYLHLACEDLRNFASFEKLKESLQGLPQSLIQLVKRSLDRLCSQHRSSPGLRRALAVLAVSTTGLRERDLYSVLNTCNDLSSRDRRLSWQEVLHLSRKPEGRVPMATFTHIAQSVQILVGSSHCYNTDDLLALTSPEVKLAFEDFLLPAESDRTRAHLILAAHLWSLADPQGADTFLHCDADSVLQLPSSLIQSEQLEPLHFLLSSYDFLYANVRHGLVHHLLETYSLYETLSVNFQDSLEDCHRFLQRHASLLSSWPTLFIQQALNELPETSAHTWAQGLMGKGGGRVVEWLNKDSQMVKETSELVSTFSSEPTCLVQSSDGELMVVGTGRGAVHFIDTQTGQEVTSLVSSCDGISSCVFLKDRRLVTTSFDGRIEIWDIGTSCRTALIDGHTNVITGSDISADQKHLATVSLDLMLKVWSSNQGHEVAALSSSSPLNCVNFDPEGRLLAAGCWDGDVIVWNWLQNKTQTSLSGHQRSVRCLCFSSSSSMLCSGSVSGEVRVWSVPTSTCVGCFQAHYGATETLTFLDEGALLLSAGSDHKLQLWSGGLGRSVAALKSESNMKAAAALCVAVNGLCAAVGFHSEGVTLFSLHSGEKTWTSSDLGGSVLCLLWVVLDAEQTEAELLVSGGTDKRLRVWKRTEGEEGMMGGLKMLKMFGVQGSILALAQNSTYLASSSDDFTVALWLLSDLALDTSVEPQVFLRGHSGGVTCLAFSPDGGQLLSGGQDQALMVWDVSSSPAGLSTSLPHAHKDWITSCVWTSDCIISSSIDGTLCLWDLQAGQRLREISWRSPLTSVCCLGLYVMAGCVEGALHVWSCKTTVEVCHITAHRQRINHCCLLPVTDKNNEANLKEMTVFTASDDGTVRVWKPLQVEHFSTFQGHSGVIRGVVCKDRLPEFLTVSEDCSLRRWTWTKDNPPSQRHSITALCFSEEEDLLLAGYESGLLEVWQNKTLVGHKQASSSTIAAVCSMPDDQFAVSYMKCVDVWKLVWNQQHSKASLVRVTTYEVTNQVVHLAYCSVLIAVFYNGTIFGFTETDEEPSGESIFNWKLEVQVLDVIHQNKNGLWLVAEKEGDLHVGFIFAMGLKNNVDDAFSSVWLQSDAEMKRNVITAATKDKGCLVVGDMKGNMWFNEPSEISSWSRQSAHSNRISVLRLTDRSIISASYDKTVKLWDRNTRKQVGLFVSGGPLVVLEVNRQTPSEVVCADEQGKLYFLCWKE